jgi:hypothetical protein
MWFFFFVRNNGMWFVLEVQNFMTLCWGAAFFSALLVWIIIKWYLFDRIGQNSNLECEDMMKDTFKKISEDDENQHD